MVSTSTLFWSGIFCNQGGLVASISRAQLGIDQASLAGFQIVSAGLLYELGKQGLDPQTLQDLSGKALKLSQIVAGHGSANTKALLGFARKLQKEIPQDLYNHAVGEARSLNDGFLLFAHVRSALAKARATFRIQPVTCFKDPIFYRKVDELTLPEKIYHVRILNALDRIQVTFIGELVQKTEIDLLKIHNFGRNSLRAVKEALAEHELSLGMKLMSFDPADAEKRRLLYHSIEELEIPGTRHMRSRILNTLRHMGIQYIGELVQKSLVDLIREGFGHNMLEAIKKALANLGLDLEMKINGFNPADAEEFHAQQSQ